MTSDDVPTWLIGRWRLLRAEAAHFRPGGRLLYTIVVEGHEHVVRLVYTVEGDVLRTDNPEHPHAVATHFALGEGGVLVFDFSGARAWFVRET
jgi:hypothetical protein